MAWIREKKWTCSHCSNTNKGRYTQCQSCGNPKDSSESYESVGGDRSHASRVTDPELLKQAHAGRNWECEYCGSHERNLTGECRNCAGKKDTKSYHPEARAPKQYHPELNSQSMNPRTYGWGNAHADDDFDESVLDSIRNAENLRVYIIVAAIVLVAIFLFWLFMPYEVDTKITSISWEHTVNLEERHLKHGEDWDGNMPNDAHNTSCSTRQRGTEDCNPHDCNPHQVQCNPHDCNCSTQCRDLGNGYESCDRVCSTCYDSCTEYDTCYDQCPVYDEWCSFDYHEWDVIKTRTVGGNSHDEYWPDFDTGGRSDLRNAHHAKYNVDFYSQEKDKTWDYEPDDLMEFQKYNTDVPWLIKVNRAGQVWPQNEL